MHLNALVTSCQAPSIWRYFELNATQNCQPRSNMESLYSTVTVHFSSPQVCIYSTESVLSTSKNPVSCPMISFKVALACCSNNVSDPLTRQSIEKLRGHETKQKRGICCTFTEESISTRLVFSCGFPGGASSNVSACQGSSCRRHRFNPGQEDPL